MVRSSSAYKAWCSGIKAGHVEISKLSQELSYYLSLPSVKGFGLMISFHSEPATESYIYGAPLMSKTNHSFTRLFIHLLDGMILTSPLAPEWPHRPHNPHMWLSSHHILPHYSQNTILLYRHMVSLADKMTPLSHR